MNLMKENNFDLLRVFAAFQVMLLHANLHLLKEQNYQTGGNN